MKLPNAEKAIIDKKKLSQYCLNPYHPIGKHKAFVFKTKLNIDFNDSEYLVKAIKNAILKEDAMAGEKDQYGERFVVDFFLSKDNKKAKIRSTWIVHKDEIIPKLTSCYII